MSDISCRSRLRFFVSLFLSIGCAGQGTALARDNWGQDSAVYPLACCGHTSGAAPGLVEHAAPRSDRLIVPAGHDAGPSQAYWLHLLAAQVLEPVHTTVTDVPVNQGARLSE